MGRNRWGLPLALVAAVLVAEAAVGVLWPGEGVIEPAPVDPGSYFSPAQMQRAEDFRGPQALLGLAIVAAELAVLALLARRPPRLLRRPVRRPLAVAALAGAGLSLAVALAPLPLRVAAQVRARDVGLVTQSWAGYAGDLALSWGIGALLAGAGAAAGVALLRRLPRAWWAAGAAVVVAFAAGSVYATPVVLDPLFNDFERLERGPLRSDVLELSRRAGVDVGEVYVMDASRRTTAANAYVAGLGSTKRVVLYDNLVDGFAPEQVRLVVAHELAHVRYDDVRNGLLYVALVAPLALLAVALATRRMAPPPGGRDGRPGPEVVPALALSIAVGVLVVTTISNQLSREVEARADSYSLELTGEPEPFIAFERRLALRNVTDPEPPGWLTFLRSTHPPVIERIGIGEAFRRERAIPGRAGAAGGRRTRGGS